MTARVATRPQHRRPTAATVDVDGARRTSPLAVAALVAGLCGLLWTGSMAAVVLGVMALADIRRSGGTTGGAGLAWAALVIAALSLTRLAFLALPGIGGGGRLPARGR